MTTTAIIYNRVSTPGQREEGTSLETQLDACQKYAADLGYTIAPEHIFQEQASGGDVNRPLLSRVRQLAKEKAAGALIVYTPDRLSRDATDLMVLSDEMAQLGVSLLFVNGPSGDAPEDKLLRFIFGYKSEAERRDITERTMRGKRQTAKNGKLPTGAGRGLYGYKSRWDTNLNTGKPTSAGREIVDEEAATVRQIFTLWNEGNSLYEIAKRLNQQNIPTKSGSQWHPLTVKRMLENSAYMGVTYYGKERVEKLKNQTKRRRTKLDKSEWIEVPGFTPAIITEDVFQRAQQRLTEPTLRTGRAIEPYLLTGHIFCGHCGAPLVGTTMRKRYRYYRCRCAWATATRGKTCDALYIQRDKLNDAVWNATRQVLEQPEIVIAEMRRLQSAEPSTLDDEMDRLQRGIRHCKDQEQRLVKLYMYGEVDDEWIKSQSGPTKSMREGYEAELKRIEAQREAAKGISTLEEQVEAYCARVRGNLDTFTFEDKRLALKALQVRAIVTETDVQIKGVVGVDDPSSGVLTIEQTSA